MSANKNSDRGSVVLLSDFRREGLTGMQEAKCMTTPDQEDVIRAKESGKLRSLRDVMAQRAAKPVGLPPYQESIRRDVDARLNGGRNLSEDPYGDQPSDVSPD